MASEPKVHIVAVKIVVTPFLEGGYSLSVNGEQTATFDNGGVATAAYAEQLLEVRRLQSVIDDHAAWLCSRTPDQLSFLTVHDLRATGQELRFLGGING
jgi:hypothetical protein